MLVRESNRRLGPATAHLATHRHAIERHGRVPVVWHAHHMAQPPERALYQRQFQRLAATGGADVLQRIALGPAHSYDAAQTG